MPLPTCELATISLTLLFPPILPRQVYASITGLVDGITITCLHIYLSKLIVSSFRDKTVCPSSCASLPLWDSSVPDVQYKCSVNFCWMNERMRNHSEITERMGPNVSELVFNLVTWRVSVLHCLPLSLPTLLFPTLCTFQRCCFYYVL